MKKDTDLNEQFGLNPTLELCRVEFKNGSLFLFVPRAIRDKLHLNDEHFLIAYCEGNHLILIKDKEMEQLLKPQILAARKVYASMKAKAIG